IDAGLLRIGDMIAYFHEGHYKHCAMFTGTFNGVGRVTCHTKSRFMGKTPPQVSDAWFLTNPGTFTLLHIPYRTAPPLGPALAGWWEVGGRAATEFFFVMQDGRAVRTTDEPKDSRAPFGHGNGGSRGYWFAEHHEVKFCWRLDGRVDVMRPKPDGKSAEILINNVTFGTATKMPLR